MFVGGAVIQWVRDGLRMIQESRDSEYYAQKVPDNGGGVYCSGLYRIGRTLLGYVARGAIVGITRGTTQNHIIRAAEESIAYQSYDLVHAMELDVGQPITALKVDGGASRDQFFDAVPGGHPEQKPCCARPSAKQRPLALPTWRALPPACGKTVGKSAACGTAT